MWVFFAVCKLSRKKLPLTLHLSNAKENSRRVILAPTSQTAVDTHLTVCHTTDDVSLSTPTAHRLLIFQLVDNDESLYFELIILYCLFVLVFADVYCLCALAPLLIVCSRARATYSHKRKCKNKHLWPDDEQYRRRRVHLHDHSECGEIIVSAFWIRFSTKNYGFCFRWTLEQSEKLIQPVRLSRCLLLKTYTFLVCTDRTQTSFSCFAMVAPCARGRNNHSHEKASTTNVILFMKIINGRKNNGIRVEKTNTQFHAVFDCLRSCN